MFQKLSCEIKEKSIKLHSQINVNKKKKKKKKKKNMNLIAMIIDISERRVKYLHVAVITEVNEVNYLSFTNDRIVKW